MAARDEVDSNLSFDDYTPSIEEEDGDFAG